MSDIDSQTQDRFLRALRRLPVDRTPVWVMRQAGRYLPEYRATRELAGDFLTLCRTPELACEVTLQPIRRFALDAAIIFSDILVIPDAMGLGLQMVESIGPVFENPIQNKSQISQLQIPDPETDLRYVLDAVNMTSQALGETFPLIGFSGSPWTLAVYMIEGQSKTDFSKIKKFAQEENSAAHQLLQILSRSVMSYLTAQANSGAKALMIFDTWGGILNSNQYADLSLRYMTEIVAHLKSQSSDTPVILFTKGGGKWLENIADSGCDGVGLDWTNDIGEARRRIGDRVALQGNLDPGFMSTTEQQVRAEVGRILDNFGHGSGHIFNLGHGIRPDANPDLVSVLVKEVHSQSEPYHRNTNRTSDL